MNLTDFVVLIPCLAALLVGYLVKNTIPKISNRFIPLICAVVGLLINMWVNMSVTPYIVVEGLISGIAATGMFEMVKNFAKEKKEDKNENS